MILIHVFQDLLEEKEIGRDHEEEEIDYINTSTCENTYVDSESS